MSFIDEFQSITENVNIELEKYLPQENVIQRNVIEAMRYSVKAGGKRLRPTLAIAVSRLLGGKDEEILPFAVAIEMIHTYSLIHDDLPCMDNDDLRRGKPTNHKVFGEAMALLAGDSLLNKAFEVMTRGALVSSNKENALRTMEYIGRASSDHGMIGGQVIDMENENKDIPIEVLQKMHELKTGALICAAVLAPAYLNNADDEKKQALLQYAQSIGLAFQVKDDILDVEGNEKLLGKKTGSDDINGKTTYITIYGIDKSKDILDKLTQKAIGALDMFGEQASFLKELAIYLLNRQK